MDMGDLAVFEFKRIPGNPIMQLPTRYCIKLAMGNVEDNTSIHWCIFWILIILEQRDIGITIKRNWTLNVKESFKIWNIVPWYMSGSLNRGGGVKRSRHSRRMHNRQIYPSGKRLMVCYGDVVVSHILW